VKARTTSAVLAADSSGLRRRYTLGELLPESFGPEDLAMVKR